MSTHAGSDHGGRGPAGLRSRSAASRRAARSTRPPAPSSTSPMTPRSSRCSPSFAPRSCSTAPPSTTWRCASARRTRRSRSTPGPSSGSPPQCTAAGAQLVHLSTNYVFDGTATEPYDEERPAEPAEHLRDLQARRRARRPGLRPGCARRSYRRALRAVRERVKGRQLRHPDDRPRSRAGRAHTSSRTSSSRRRSPPISPSGILAAVDAGVTGTLHVTNSGATSWHGFTEAIMELAGVEVPVEEGITTIAPGAADRPLNGVLRSTGVGACRPAGAAALARRRSPITSNAPACWPARPSDDQQQPRGNR